MEDFVTFEQAKILKELGFDGICDHYYNPYGQYLKKQCYRNFNKETMYGNINGRIGLIEPVSAPRLAQAQKWLREKGKIILINVVPELKQYYWNLYDESFSFRGACNANYKTYGLALSAGIDKVLELLIKQENGE